MPSCWRVATIFIAQISGANLTFGQLVTVVIIAVVASIGTAGVPGVGLIMLAMVLNAVDLNPAAIGIILGQPLVHRLYQLMPQLQ